MRVAALPGLLAERESLHDGLAIALIKDRRDMPAFDRVFDAFFGKRNDVAVDTGHVDTHDDSEGTREVEQATLGDEPLHNSDRNRGQGKPDEIQDLFEAEDLASRHNLNQEDDRIYTSASNDDIALAADQGNVSDAAAQVELAVSRLHGVAQPGELLTGDASPLEAMLSMAEELALLEWLADEIGTDNDLDPAELARLRRRMGALLDQLPERIASHLQELLSLRDPTAESPGAGNLDAHDPLDEEQRTELEESLRRLVRTLHGAPHPRRRVSAAGRVDGGRTMRSCMAYDGVPFRPVTVSRPHDRPRLVVLVDVSLSVRATSRFTLHVVHGLQSLVSAVRSWVFVADVVETTDVFAERHAEEALSLLVAGLPAGGLLDVDADSDYGKVFGAFLEEYGTALNRRTTLLVLGDGRGNGHDPNVAAFAEMTRRVRETIWLTPEPSYSWALGRCDLPLYAEYCTRVQIVRDLGGLSRLQHTA